MTRVLLFFLAGFCAGWWRREDPFVKDFDRAVRLSQWDGPR